LTEHHAINAHGAMGVQPHSLQASAQHRGGQLPASAALHTVERIGLTSGLDVQINQKNLLLVPGIKPRFHGRTPRLPVSVSDF